jgi:hypothetical protein
MPTDRSAAAKKTASNAKVLLPVLALVFALRIMLDIHRGYWTFAKDFVDRLFPCVLIALGVKFFWDLFQHIGRSQ